MLVSIILIIFMIFDLNLERRQCIANSICCLNFNILCITETWLTNDVPANSLFLSNFSILRSDGPKKMDFSYSHGGVLIAFKQSLKISKLANNMVDPFDVVFASIDRSSCIMACIYIPPKNSPYYWTTTKLLDFFKTLQLLLLHGTHSPEYMVTTGNLNFSSTNWGSMESTDPSESLFLDNLVDLDFQQKLHESAGTSLDVFLISSEVKHINSRLCLELEKLLYDNWNKKFDYVPFSSSILVEYEPVQAVSWKSGSFSNVDWELVNKVISDNPFDPFCLSNLNVLLSEWYIWINRIMDKTIPVKTKHRRSLPPWVSSETSNQMKRHNTLLNNLIKNKADIANKASSFLSETSLINLESKADASASALNERLQFDQEDYAGDICWKEFL